MNRLTLIIFAMLLSICSYTPLTAQQQGATTKMTDPGELYSTYSLSKNQSELEQQFGTTKASEIIKYGHENNWPEGFNTFDERQTDPAQAALKKLKVRVIGYLAAGPMIVSVSREDNPYIESKYLPPAGRPFYIVIKKTGLENASLPQASGSSTTQGSTTKISLPGKLYSTYSLSDNKSELESTFGATKAREIIKYAHEDNWPYGISEFDTRIKEPGQEALKKYKVRVIYALDSDTRIVSISKEDNPYMESKYLPPAGQPFYIVIQTIGLNDPTVQSSGSSSSSSYSAPQQGATTKISLPGKLYSTYSLSDNKSELESTFGATKAREIIKYAHEDNWPYGISEFDTRIKEPGQEALKKYKVRVIYSLDSDTRIVSISREDNPYMENKYLPPAGQPFYIVIQKIGLNDPTVQSSGSSSSYSAPQQGATTKINLPGKLYSTYSLSDNKSELESAFGATKARDIIKYAHEDNWPYGISEFDTRIEEPGQEALKKYKVRVIYSLDSDTRIVSISREDNPYMENKYLPPAGQPFYIVIQKIGLADPTVTTTSNNNSGGTKASQRVGQSQR